MFEVDPHHSLGACLVCAASLDALYFTDRYLRTHPGRRLAASDHFPAALLDEPEQFKVY